MALGAIVKEIKEWREKEERKKKWRNCPECGVQIGYMGRFAFWLGMRLCNDCPLFR